MKPGGELDLHGKRYVPTWTRLAATAAAGSRTLRLREAVGWEAGQQVVVTTTVWKVGARGAVHAGGGEGAWQGAGLARPHRPPALHAPVPPHPSPPPHPPTHHTRRTSRPTRTRWWRWRGCRTGGAPCTSPPPCSTSTMGGWVGVGGRWEWRGGGGRAQRAGVVGRPRPAAPHRPPPSPRSRGHPPSLLPPCRGPEYQAEVGLLSRTILLQARASLACLLDHPCMPACLAAPPPAPTRPTPPPTLPNPPPTPHPHTNTRTAAAGRRGGRGHPARRARAHRGQRATGGGGVVPHGPAEPKG